MAQITSIVKDAQLEATRVPPQSIEAEQSVLGGLLLDNTAWDRISDLITAADLYRADHRLILEHIGGLIESGRPADALTVAESLERSGQLAEVGGHAYLGALAANTPQRSQYPALCGDCSRALCHAQSRCNRHGDRGCRL